METIKAKDIIVGDVILKSKRKNAKTFTVSKCEVVGGEAWKNYPKLKGQIFLIGSVGASSCGQKMLSPEADVLIKKRG